MERKDIFVGLILSFIPLGIGHFYIGDKRRGITILGVQIFLLILSGIVAPFSTTILALIYLGILGVGIWAGYDTVTTIKLINEHM